MNDLMVDGKADASLDRDGPSDNIFFLSVSILMAIDYASWSAAVNVHRPMDRTSCYS